MFLVVHVSQAMCLQRGGSHVTATHVCIGQSQVTWEHPALALVPSHHGTPPILLICKCPGPFLSPRHVLVCDLTVQAHPTPHPRLAGKRVVGILLKCLLASNSLT